MPENTSVAFSSVFLDKAPPIDVRIDEMMQWGKKISEYGFIPGAEGNLSFRTKMGFVITGSGISLDNMTKDTVVEVKGVVSGLNRPSIYAKGQVVPSKETLLHSAIYEALPEINAIICIPNRGVLETAMKKGISMTSVAQLAGSQELVQEAVNLIKLNPNVRCFILKNYCVVALGTTISDAGKHIESMQVITETHVKVKYGKKKLST